MENIVLKVEDSIAQLTLHCPPANALSSEMIAKLDKHLDRIENNERVKVVILKGDGSFFSAGANIKELKSYVDTAEYESLALKGQGVFHRMEQFPIPIIAAIHGAALGGGLELAMACHIRVVTMSAKLGLPELSLGIIPGFAGTQRLPQFVGYPKAYEMLLTAEAMSGEEAHFYGLANVVVDEMDLLPTVRRMAELIAAKSKPTIHHIMNLIMESKSGNFLESSKKEAAIFGEVFANEDAQEGIKAFMEKRKPWFRDK